MPKQAVVKTKHPNGQPVTFADIRLEYIMGDMTLKELAAKHGAAFSTLMKRSAREGWEVDRKIQADRVVAEAQQSAIAKRSQALVEFNEADLGLARALRSMVARKITEARQNQGDLSPKDLRALAATAGEAQRIGRLALGVSTDNHGHGGENGLGPIPVSSVPMEAYLAARDAVLQEF